jgi:hypothetical protein
MIAYLISCDHATCAVPEPYREIFRGSEEVVSSKEGWEPGALNLAQGFAMKFSTPLVHAGATQLLIHLEQEGDACWSPFSLKLPESMRAKVVDRYQRPYRLVLNQRIAEDLRRHPAVLHVMVHTDPATDGLIMLETPAGAVLAEKYAAAWCTRLAAGNLDVRHVSQVSLNPMAASLAESFPADCYAQIRLSVSQTFFLEGRPLRWDTLKKLLLESLALVAKDVSVISGPEGSSIDPS